jgi:hypothetical protein
MCSCFPVKASTAPVLASNEPNAGMGPAMTEPADHAGYTNRARSEVILSSFSRQGPPQHRGHQR